MARWNSLIALVFASQAGYHVRSEIVEASTVTDVFVTANGRNERSEEMAAVSGCSLRGCDPRLTEDGENHNAPGLWWACEASDSRTCEVMLTVTMDDVFTIDHIMLYLYESDNTTHQVSIPFEIQPGWTGFADNVSGLSTPGPAIDLKQRASYDETISYTSDGDRVSFMAFGLEDGQHVNLSEVKVYLNVENSDDTVALPPPDALHFGDGVTITRSS